MPNDLVFLVGIAVIGTALVVTIFQAVRFFRDNPGKKRGDDEGPNDPQ